MGGYGWCGWSVDGVDRVSFIHTYIHTTVDANADVEDNINVLIEDGN